MCHKSRSSCEQFLKKCIFLLSWRIEASASKINVTATLSHHPPSPERSSSRSVSAFGCRRPGAADGRLVPSPKSSSQDGRLDRLPLCRRPAANTMTNVQSPKNRAQRETERAGLEATFNPPPAADARDALTQSFIHLPPNISQNSSTKSSENPFVRVLKSIKAMNQWMNTDLFSCHRL